MGVGDGTGTSFCSLVTFSQSSTSIDFSPSGMNNLTAGRRMKSSSYFASFVSGGTFFLVWTRASGHA